MSARRRRRVAVTGVGVVSSLGCDVPTFWQSCIGGRSVVAPIPERWRCSSDFRSAYWSPLGDWDRPTRLLTALEAKHLDPVAHLSLLAAEEALAMAALDLEVSDHKRNRYRVSACPPERSAVFMGTGIGGIVSALRSHSFVALERPKRRLSQSTRSLAQLGGAEGVAADLDAVQELLAAPRAFDPFAVPMAMPNAVSVNLSIKLGFQGPSRAYSSACASATVAIGQAFHALREGVCDVALAGGAEYLGDGEGGCFRGFDALGALVQGSLPPERINRPFDEDRCGFLFSEGGAGVLMLEELERAQRRGAEILAEVTGYGETCDAYHLVGMEPDGTQIRRTLEMALADAGVEPGDIDYVNTHGTGTAANDRIEGQVLEQLFGERPAVNSTKSLLGHTLGASGAIEAVVTTLSLRDGTTHPCRNLERPICPLGFVRHAGPLSLRRAVSQSFAFGGQNAALVFSAP